MSGSNIGYSLSQKLPTFEEFQQIFTSNADATKAAVDVLLELNDDVQEKRRANRAANANNAPKQYTGNAGAIAISQSGGDPSSGGMMPSIDQNAAIRESDTTIVNSETAAVATTTARKQNKVSYP
jgi:hypothetical protein